MTKKLLMDKKKIHISPIRISVIYLVLSLLWIFFSDRILILAIKDVYVLSELQTIKGFFFVAVTAVIIYFLIQRDIKAIYKKHFQLEKSEEKYRAFFETSMDAILLSAPDGRILAANSAACKMFRYTEEEICKLGRSGLVDPNDSRTAELVAQRQASGKVFGELNMVRADGTVFPVELSSAIFHNSDGDENTSMVIRDITDQKRLLQSIVEAKEKAEEMSRLKSNFLSNMSHEIRTPLNGILGYTEIMMSEFSDPEHLHMAGTVNESGKRLLETLNLILDLARIESNKQELLIAKIDIGLLVNRCLNLYSKAVDKKRINFVFTDRTGGIQFNSDERVLENVLNNLINNAVKFTDEGTITVIVDQIEIENEPWLRFSVEDTGIGISQENQKVIFEEFRQVSEGYNRRFEGTGLGLTICKRYMDVLGGKIELESVPGRGSKFMFMIPLADNEPAKSKKSESIHQSETQVLLPEILLVDDDAITRDFVPRILKKDFRVDTAANGPAALEKLSAKKYDLILLDIGLNSEMNGIEVLQLIRKDKAYKNTPVIAFTAYAMKSEKEKFLENGFNGYISKPFSKEVLVDVIEKGLKG